MKGALEVMGCLVREGKKTTFVTVFAKSREAVTSKGPCFGNPKAGLFLEVCAVDNCRYR